MFLKTISYRKRNYFITKNNSFSMLCSRIYILDDDSYYAHGFYRVLKGYTKRSYYNKVFDRGECTKRFGTSTQ